jgi:hypothetical protein
MILLSIGIVIWFLIVSAIAICRIEKEFDSVSQEYMPGYGSTQKEYDEYLAKLPVD